MAGILQRLAPQQALYTTKYNASSINIADIEAYSPTWTPSAEQTSISYSTNDYFVDNTYVMRIVPGLSTATITLDVTDSFSVDDAGSIFVFHAQFKSVNSSYSTSIRLTNSTDDASDEANQFPSSTSNTAISTDHNGGFWSTARSNLMTAPVNSGTATYELTIEISNHGNQAILMTAPCLVIDNVWVRSDAVRNIAKFMPDLYLEKDIALSNPIGPFFRFIDAGTYQINNSMQAYSEWFEYEASEIPYYYDENVLAYKSALTDSEAARLEYAPWLFQFIGHPQVNDITVSGGSYIADVDDFRIWQLQNSYFGRAAGTTQAIRESVKQVLSGTKTVVITADGANWEISIKTLASESPFFTTRLATTAPINLSTELENGDTIDGEVLATNDRVLVKNQSTASQNGIYVVQASGAAVRATDFDTTAEVVTGAFVYVNEGTANGGTAWTVSTTGTITVGTTAIAWASAGRTNAVLQAAEYARPLGYAINHEAVENLGFILGSVTYGELGDDEL